MDTKNMAGKFGHLDAKQVVFMLCDVQDKFRDVIAHFQCIVQSCAKLIAAGRALDVPLVVTKQYPKGLGDTVRELNIGHAVLVEEKTSFSMMTPTVRDKLRELGEPMVVVIMGLEAHVCVEQTAIDLLEMGRVVHVVADAVSSRSQEDRLLALQRLRQAGCFISTTESIMFKLLRDKDHPKFSEIRALVKSTSPETGLAKM